jgi:hypothetical protein
LCSTSADCCPGEVCESNPGSASGVCGPCIISDGGVPDSGTDSGTGDSGTGDSGTGDGGLCSSYGQLCHMSSDCCNGVPCNQPLTPGCPSGANNCTCHYLIN